jgi:drug/metabolite transporter (DMT)-like permease
MPVDAAPALAVPRTELLRGNLLVALGIVLWATAFPLTDRLLLAWDPVLLVPFRLGIGAITLLMLVLVLQGRHALSDVPWRSAFLVGGLGGCGVVLFVAGQALSDGVTASIITTTGPAIALLLAWVGARGRPSAVALCGVALAIVGGVLASLGGASLRAGFRGGELLLLAAVVLWTWYSHAGVARLPLLGDLARSAVLLGCGAVAAGLVALLALGAGIARPRVGVEAPALLELLWVGTVAVGLSMPLWFAGVRRLGVTVASMHQNMAPVYVMLMALAVGGALVVEQAVGALLVLAGAAITQLRARG